MRFAIYTLFPDYFSLSMRQSLVGKAQEKGLFDISIRNPRDFATDKHHTVDDNPFGGGGGMVMKLEPIDLCLEREGWRRTADGGIDRAKERLILTSAAGTPFTQAMAIELSLCERVGIICGHYLGIDERLVDLYDVDEVSIGDYILTGGEAAAAVMVDAVARLIPKVLGNFESALGDSYMNQMLGSPCYTRPPEYRDIPVPAALMSGNHAEIARWRIKAAIRKCLKNRPDLLEKADLSDLELRLIDEVKKEDFDNTEKGHTS